MSPHPLTSIAAFARRDARVEATHRLPYVIDLLAVAAGVAVFYYLARFAGRGPGRGDLFPFVVAGLAVLRVNAALPRIVHRFEGEVALGSLAQLLSSRLSSAVVMAGEAAFELLRGCVLGLFLVLLAAGLVEPDLHLGAVAVAGVLIGLAGAAVVSLGLAAGLTGLYLVLRLGLSLSALATIAVPLLAGAYFPIDELPQPLHALATVLPFDDSVDIVRHALLRGEIDAAALARLAAGAAIVLPLGFWTLHLGTRHSRRVGTLAIP
ncbi:MAG TPA: ABC transporter permease [Thermoleophilaceae bacterium]|jgi:ABC-type multidrug transport system permease subunit